MKKTLAQILRQKSEQTSSTINNVKNISQGLFSKNLGKVYFPNSYN